MLSFFRKKSSAFRHTPKSSSPRARLNVEALESRLVPYALSGAAWGQPQLLTIGFVPDGTDLGGVSSNLISNFNSRFGSQSAWQNAILKAAQVWAQQTNLNFALVTDNGAAVGSGEWLQGDPNMADIRIGGYNFGTTTLGRAYLPAPTNNFSIAGDIQLNTSQSWVMGTTGGFDVFTVAMHEFGHALGLQHSTNYHAAMYPSYIGARQGLGTDDIDGIRANYGGSGRTQDLFDQLLPNNTLATASYLDVLLQSSSTAVINDLDITSPGDVDYWTFAAPTSTTGTLTVKVQTAGLSMLQGSFGLYNESLQLVGFATGAGQYGSTLTMTVNNVQAGQRFYLAAVSADVQSPFGTGKYALTLNFGSGELPAVALSAMQTAVGYPLVGGSGAAVEDGFEYQVNTPSTGLFTLGQSFAEKATAMDNEGNSVAAWIGNVLDGSGYNVYARRYNSAGEAQGDPFLVSSTTDGMQMNAAVDMDDAGNFVVTWSSWNQTEGWSVLARRFSAAGDALGTEFQVGEANANFSSVAVDSVGNFVITWFFQDSTTGHGEIYAQRFDAAGAALGDPFRVSTDTPGDNLYASVAMSNEGAFAITWSNNAYTGDGSDVYAQLFDAAGQAIGTAFRVNTTTIGEQQHSSVSMDAVGNFAIAWVGPDGDFDGIFARRYSATGEALSEEFLVNDATTGPQSSPALGMGAAGGFVVTWTSNDSDGSGLNVHARLYNANGEVQGDQFLVNRTREGGQQSSSVAMNAAGDFVIVWHGSGVGGVSGIFAQRYLVHPDGINGEFNPEGCPDHEAGCTCEACTAAINAVLAEAENRFNDLLGNDTATDEPAPSVASDLTFADESWTDDTSDVPEVTESEEAGDSDSDTVPEELPA